MSLGMFGKLLGLCLDLPSQGGFPELPLRRQLFAARSQLGSQLGCLWAGLGKIWPLPKPVQSELVSRASLKEAAFCNQVPAGIPNLNVFGQVWEILGPLLGPVQSECVSRAPLKDAAFCSQVPAGIPT